MIETLTNEHVQMMIALSVITGILCHRWGYISGLHTGYQDGMRDLYKTIVMNDLGNVSWKPPKGEKPS